MNLSLKAGVKQLIVSLNRHQVSNSVSVQTNCTKVKFQTNSTICPFDINTHCVTPT